MDARPRPLRQTSRLAVGCWSLLMGIAATASGAEPAATPNATSANASETAPEVSPLVEWMGTKMPYSEVVSTARDSRTLQEYLKLRVTTPKTIDGQWKLAQWCGKHGLKEQYRAHLTAIVDRQPNHTFARAALGQKLVNGVWLTREEQAAQTTAREAAVASRKKWEPKLRQLVAQAGAKDIKRSAAALDELTAIRDVGAIPTLERIVSPEADARLGTAVVEAVAEMPADLATMSLARHSVYHHSGEVREQAAVALRKRPQMTYVPAMLGEMFTPVVSQTTYINGRHGVEVMQTFYREGEQEKQLATFDAVVEIRGNDDDEEDRSAARLASMQARAVAYRNQQLAEMQNERTRQMNERICTALQISVNQVLPGDPEAWWQWWNERNELYVAEKPVRRGYASESYSVVARPRSHKKCDCLAAGTEVLTSVGPVMVEDLQVGDLVLSQNPDTGELAYKPVLATTVRPSGVLTRIRTDEGEYLTSGGHPLWVVDRGWEKARNIKPGDKLRGVESSALVRSVEEAYEAPTYNVIVADYHTYFAGPAQIISHDNTLCRQIANAATEAQP